MTWNAHSKVSLAQTIFHVPAIFAAAYLLFIKHGRPRMPWYGLTVFTIVRAVGGIILIVFEQHQSSVGWIIASTIFQGTGVFPLILCTIGLLRIIIYVDFPDSEPLKRSIIGLRILFLAAVALVVAGGVYIGNYKNADSVKEGEKLAQAGYVIIAVALAALLAFNAFLWTQKERLSPDVGRKVLLALSLSFPFIAVRITYACLSVFDGLRWSPLFGSVPAFVIMHSLMEYIVVIIYLGLGLTMSTITSEGAGAPIRQKQSFDEEAAK